MAPRPFNVLSVCSGVGGLDLGLRLAVPAARCVCYVEGEAYAAAVLAARMEDETLDAAPVWSDLRSFDARPWRGTVDCVTGGYPCQPFSVAGRLRGADDPRHLWPEVARVVGECAPAFCFFENVGNHLRVGFEQVHDDLQRMGYRVAAGLFTAAEVGAPHKRERLFIVAHAERAQRRQDAGGREPVADRRNGRREEAASSLGSGDAVLAHAAGVTEREPWARADAVVSGGEARQTVGRGSGDVGRAHEPRPQGRLGPVAPGADALPAWPPGPAMVAEWQRVLHAAPWLAPAVGHGDEPRADAHPAAGPPRRAAGEPGAPDDGGAAAEPAVRRVADGLAHRLDRLRACGNGVVPAVACYAWHVLTDALALGQERRAA